MTPWDYSVVIFYLLFILSIGFVFQRFSSTISDYFRGGGSIQWWMLGSSIFMVQFSAWTFTGAAGKAYSMGIFILSIFLGNAVGFLINFLGIGARLRQLRVITNLDAVKERYNRFTEQFYFVVGFVSDFLAPAFWLFSLSIFVSSVFGMNLRMVIIGTGVVVVFMSMTGGSWAVIASDFIQSLLLTLIAITTTVLILKHPEVGGFSGFMEKVPEELFSFSKMGNSWIVWSFAAMFFVKQVITTNTLQTAYRYVAARDSKHAKWAAFLAMILVTTGPFFWFLPPMAAHILVPDLAALFPALKNPEEGAYIASAMQVLPVGMMGLLVSGIFAATMSCMDTGLNTKAAQVVKNFYLPNIRPHASEKELLLVGRLFTLFFGALIITVTLFLENIKGWTLFDLYLLVTGVVALPMLVPQFWGILIKKTPRWAGWTATVFGFVMAVITHIVVKGNEQQVADVLGIGVLSANDVKDLYFVAMNGGIILFCSIFFLGTIPFYNRCTTAEDREGLDQLFIKMKTPVIFEEEEGANASHDAMQFKVLGILATVFAAFLLFLIVIPNDLQGRMAFLACGGVMLLIGLLLLNGYRLVKKREEATGIHEKSLGYSRKTE